MSPTVNPKLYELAADFLVQRKGITRKADIRDLAETIRQAIGLWFCANEGDLDMGSRMWRDANGIKRYSRKRPGEKDRREQSPAQSGRGKKTPENTSDRVVVAAGHSSSSSFEETTK